MNGLQIRFARMEMKIEAQDLANELGVSRQTINNWENDPDLSDGKFRSALVAIGRIAERRQLQSRCAAGR